MGIEIKNLRPEVQTLVNSAPSKYDPNRNGMIDDGDELSLLLSEYQCNKFNLTNKSGFKLWTQTERLDIEARTNKKVKEDFSVIDNIAGGIAAGGIATGVVMSIVAGTVDPYEYVPKLKKVSDGSFIPGAKPAADIYSTIDKKPFMITHTGDANGRVKYTTLQGLADSSSHCTSGVVLGNGGHGYDGLRHWQPGDPQFVRDLKDTVKVKSSLPKKILMRAGLIGGGLLLTSLIGGAIAKMIIKNKAENQAKTEIKAEQAQIGGDLMDQRRAHEEEMRQRQAAMDQQELAYRQGMDKATKNIEKQVSAAQRKAKQLNKDLSKAQEAFDKQQVADSLQVK